MHDPEKKHVQIYMCKCIYVAVCYQNKYVFHSLCHRLNDQNQLLHVVLIERNRGVELAVKGDLQAHFRIRLTYHFSGNG